MAIGLITGSCGLIGVQSALFFAQKGLAIVGIDNDMRSYFFGPQASTQGMRSYLENRIKTYIHKTVDIRDYPGMENIFKEFNRDIELIIHTAAQPSHDWAALEPMTDFSVNAAATLNVLELTRQYCPKAVFIFTSTNKVYGDLPNALPVEERVTRWELPQSHLFYQGIDETMSVDQSMHSLFGASKMAADILVQEYGRYFGLKTACFRGGCLTGPHHAGVALHGFLSYLVQCAVKAEPYTIFGYKGKQVRDNIHSHDLVQAFDCFYQAPRCGEVYNIGGGRKNNCSVLEAIRLCEQITGRTMKYSYDDKNRAGDHVWYISKMDKFQSHYPQWQQQWTLQSTVEQMADQLTK